VVLAAVADRSVVTGVKTRMRSSGEHRRRAPHHPRDHGVEGVGEAGTTGALAAIMSANADALPGDAGTTPATPYKIWRAYNQPQSVG
jgi:hypothetical protein